MSLSLQKEICISWHKKISVQLTEEFKSAECTVFYTCCEVRSNRCNHSILELNKAARALIITYNKFTVFFYDENSLTARQTANIRRYNEKEITIPLILFWLGHMSRKRYSIHCLSPKYQNKNIAKFIIQIPQFLRRSAMPQIYCPDIRTFI